MDAIETIDFGEHKGKRFGALVISCGYWINWALEQHRPTGPLAEAVPRIRSLISTIDSLPFLVECDSQICKAGASRMLISDDGSSHCFSCERCDQQVIVGEYEGYVTVRTYSDLLGYLRLYQKNQQGTANRLVKKLVKAKGWKGNVVPKNLLRFFHGVEGAA